MRILIMGAGAIGGVMGGYLTQAGEDVTLVRRSVEAVQAMRDRGLRIDGVLGDFLIPVKAATPNGLEGEFDLVFLVVRALQTAEALDQVIPHVAPAGLLVSVQNGVESKDVLVEKFGRERSLAAMVRLGAAGREPGHVSHTSHGIFRVGELDGSMTPRLEMVRQLVNKVAPTESTANVFGWLWSKQVYTCLMNLTALVKATIGEVMALPGTEELAIRAMREGATVACAEGVRPQVFDFLDPNALLGDSPADRARTRQDLATIRARTGHTETGVARDLARGVRSEAHDLSGEIVRRARRIGVPTPVLSRMIEMITEIEQGRRKQSPDNLVELAATA